MNLSQMILLYANRIDFHKRAKLTGILARAYARQREPHPDQENILLALTAMAADPALEVRSALSEVVSGSPHFPRSLHLILSKDLAKVSEPIFARSILLSDTELLKGVMNNNHNVQCAIAGRPELSPLVVDALAQYACTAAVLKLLGNTQSLLTLDAAEQIWQRFENPTNAHHKQVMAYLLQRPDVSAFVKLKIDFLGDVTGEPPRPDLRLLEYRLDQIIMRTAKAERFELPQIARFLSERQWLNTFVIIRAALAGQFGFTAALLSEASSFKLRHTLRLCRMGGFGLSLLCRYAGLSKSSRQLLVAILEETKSLQDGQPIGQQAVSRLIKKMEANGASVHDALYYLMLQLEARELIDNAQQIRYDLALKSIVVPQMPKPTAMQDEVAVQKRRSGGTDVERPFGTTGKGNFGSFGSCNLAYKTLSA